MNLLNTKAPDFTLLDQNEIPRTLSSYQGRKVLLYFYPKDSTPGCTAEACSFRDSMKELSTYATILGVSGDSTKSHAKFVEKFSLNFPLLADTEKTVAKAYGVWVEKSFMGKKYMGMQRDSFLIDENGTIIKHYEKVNPGTHAQEVLKDVTTM